MAAFKAYAKKTVALTGASGHIGNVVMDRKD
jgi:hypothetical protein